MLKAGSGLCWYWKKLFLKAINCGLEERSMTVKRVLERRFSTFWKAKKRWNSSISTIKWERAEEPFLDDILFYFGGPTASDSPLARQDGLLSRNIHEEGESILLLKHGNILTLITTRLTDKQKFPIIRVLDRLLIFALNSVRPRISSHKSLNFSEAQFLIYFF